MEYISSDTNVWLDFVAVDRVELPFRLPFVYIMSNDAIDDELLSPAGLGSALRDLGLVGVDMSMDEFDLAAEYGSRYPKLSVYDRIALSVAKVRDITLLTGDGALRKAAHAEGVRYIGTIRILDLLYEGKYIDKGEYRYCLGELERQNGGKVRLPGKELRSRIERL